MRIYCALIHRALTAHVSADPAGALARGFYTTRWVLAGDEAKATDKTLRSAKDELSKWPDVRDRLMSTRLEVEDISPGSFWRWLRGGGRGFTFYTEA